MLDAPPGGHERRPDRRGARAATVARRLGFRAARPADSTAADRSGAIAQRLDTATGRDEGARGRDHIGATRDRLADARDKRAELRDAVAESRERRAVDSDVDDLIDALERTALLPPRAANLQRATAPRRRVTGRRRRTTADHAEEDRRTLRRGPPTRRGWTNSPASSAARLESSRSRMRSSGRAGRGDPLILAMIDVDALKAVNDRRDTPPATPFCVTSQRRSPRRCAPTTSPCAGAATNSSAASLTSPSTSPRPHRRDPASARDRRPGASISAGLAELADDTLESLIARADAELYAAKARRAS